MKFLRWPGWILVVLALVLAFAWAYGALHYNGPAKLLAPMLPAAALAVLVCVRSWERKLGILVALFTLVLGWWLTLKPSNDANWQPDVAQFASADVHGDEVTLRNVRNFDYRTETDYTPHWETRTVRISEVTGIDLAINYWGSPWMAHPIVSFQFTDATPVCFSIETRKKVGQRYSAIKGLYRQFELTYIVADERDVIRVRTNCRHGEDIYLYRTTVTPAQARERFREYLRSIDQLRDHPRWYNAVATNCTTAIRDQHPEAERIPWDWRILLNGKADELMFERGTLATGGLPFAELKAQALLNASAKAADAAPDFSRLVRSGRAGF